MKLIQKRRKKMGSRKLSDLTEEEKLELQEKEDAVHNLLKADVHGAELTNATVELDALRLHMGLD